MKAAVFLILSLFSMNALSEIHLTEVQKIYIKHGWTCCYSDEVIQQLQEPLYYSEQDDTITFNFTERGEPANKWHWATFWTLQALDVYTTDRGMQYDCVYEVNPLLPKKPSLERLVLHKSITLIPFKHLSDVLEPSDRELFLSTALTGLVVLNNFKVLDRAKRNCNKIN